MKHSLRLFSLFISFAIFLLVSCDSTDGPTNVFQDEPVISGLQVNPAELSFTVDDCASDTLVSFQISAQSDLPDDYRMVAVLASSSDRTQIDSDTLITVGDGASYNGTLSAELQATDHRNLLVYVYATGPDGKISNRAETAINIRGTACGFPEVLRIEHPDTVYIPSPGDTIAFAITAEVTHSVSRSLIDRVRLELYYPDTEENFFESSMEEVTPGSNDGHYFQGFSLNSNNNPNDVTVQIYAVDNSGTHSDTLRSQFIIAR